MKVLAQRSTFWRVIYDAGLVILLLIATYNSIQLRNETHARQHAAYSNCLASNDARQVIVNILISAQALVQASPTLNQEQKAQSLTFYREQIKKITFTDCSTFLT